MARTIKFIGPVNRKNNTTRGCKPAEKRARSVDDATPDVKRARVELPARDPTRVWWQFICADSARENTLVLFDPTSVPAAEHAALIERVTYNPYLIDRVVDRNLDASKPSHDSDDDVYPPGVWINQPEDGEEIRITKSVSVFY